MNDESVLRQEPQRPTGCRHVSFRDTFSRVVLDVRRLASLPTVVRLRHLRTLCDDDELVFSVACKLRNGDGC